VGGEDRADKEEDHAQQSACNINGAKRLLVLPTREEQEEISTNY
jgi:hypothetical protein